MHVLCWIHTQPLTFRNWRQHNADRLDLWWTTTHELAVEHQCLKLSSGYPWKNAAPETKLVAIPTTKLHPMMTPARGHKTRCLIPYASTLLYKHSFSHDSIRIWNNLLQRSVDSTPSMNSNRRSWHAVYAYHHLLSSFNFTCTVYTCSQCFTEIKPKCNDTLKSPELYRKKKTNAIQILSSFLFS